MSARQTLSVKQTASAAGDITDNYTRRFFIFNLINSERGIFTSSRVNQSPAGFHPPVDYLDMPPLEDESTVLKEVD